MARKVTTEDFIMRAEVVQKHKNRNYDYSLVNYIRNDKEVQIICPIHGPFWQRPTNHLNGQGCYKCYVENRPKVLYTTNDFVERSLKIENNAYKYSYEKVQYLGVAKKVEIICRKHGPFWQTPNHHLQGVGCPYCANVGRITNDSVDKFLINRNIKRIEDVKGGKTKILWGCLKDCCGHKWSATPNGILSGSGCPRCAGTMPKTNADIDFAIKDRNIKRIENIVNMMSRITWRCLNVCCNYEWVTSPNAVLNKGTGCPQCAGLTPSTNQKIDNLLKERSIVRIGDIYGTHRKVLWKCLIDGCNHEWSATPHNILQGSNCPLCAKSGFKSNLPSVIYVYVIDDEYCGYGISNNFEKRNKEHQTTFKKLNITAEIIVVYECSGSEARRIETILKRKFKPINLQIDGFRRESTLLQNLPNVLQCITDNLKDS